MTRSRTIGADRTDDRPVRVLLIDDDEEFARQAADLIGRESDRLAVEVATDGPDALDRLESSSIDCVVADYAMSSMDGLTLLARVREAHPDLPFILFTGAGSEEVASEAIAAGVTDYVRKRTGREQYTLLANRIERSVERYRAEADLREERRRYELIGQATGDAFWDWDLDSDRVERSDGYADLLGFDPAEVGDDADWWVERVHPDDEATISEVANGAMERGDDWYEVDYRVRTAEGDYKPVRTRARIVYDDDGEPTRIVGAVSDISDLVRQNERLEAFASVVSHDLRNPLNVLEATLRNAEGTGEPVDVERCLRVVGRMRRLVDDVLALARQGEAIDEPAPVDLAVVAERAWESVETAEATLRIDADVVIEADAGRLEQLFENCFRNAVEHGGPEVDVVVEELESPAGFAIEDDGPGIPEEERERVFESGYSTSAAGTGFGLAIVSEIAGAHGWDVRASEGAAGGARVEITGVERAA